ncbi:heavy metal translocating P-type ATPase [Kangiella koreensis]|uniref:Heavy metal translocating P-type ATPase n=1 Tax=Kangiella koreensis (strain DSM 16069 / JCM 12317 / KCTC 12182 / SW-125) TaxID=523791 RepID=C7R8U7_KANKD|nr:heavy metal translocating P-type ATPase [Kangiella koreensis]ACV25960.1 heavy metal translocating P-type ATPase [Kangiella koreensis DSM 16069]
MDAKVRGECFHCGLPIPANYHQTLEVLNKEREFCCAGCYSVAETIVNNGLTDYYQFRTEQAIRPDQELPPELIAFDEEDIQAEYLVGENNNSATNDKSSSIILLSESIRCSACAWLIERTLRKLTGVTGAQVNVAAQTINLQWQPETIELSKILKRLHQLGYAALPYKPEQALAINIKQQKSWLRRLGMAGLGMMQVMMYAVGLYLGAWDDVNQQHGHFLRWVSFFIATPVLFYAGFPFYFSAIQSLRQFRLNMDVPITLALFLAYSASIWAVITQSGEVYFDSVTMFVFFLLIGRYLEFRARQQVSEKVYKGQNTLPVYAEKIDYEQSQGKMISLKKLQQSDEILIRPGATVPIDGELITEQAEVNEAMLNGEFLPRQKHQGQMVMAGSVNTHQAIRIKVTSNASNSYWTKLLSMQEAALLEKPKIGLLADTVARYFVLFILLLATVVAWYWLRHEPQEALWITLSVLVVSCPCALGLATPIAMTCGALAHNQRNVLIKGQHFLQNTSHITDVIFDKTGTLTEGTFTVDKVELFADRSKEQVLAIIAALEVQSEHPIALAFYEYQSKDVVANDIEHHSFAGVSGKIGGQQYWFGNRQFIESRGATIELPSDSGLWLYDGQHLIAHIVLTDKIRQQAKSMVEQLKDKGYRLHILSGDPSEQTEKVAKQLGIELWSHAMLPEQKLSYVKSLQTNGARVLMVGDGLNDAPVMSAADSSIAMAKASDLTRTTADAYLLSEKLLDIPFVLRKSRQTQSVIKQNISWALAYNTVMIPFAAMGYIPPYLAAIGMSLSSIVVVLNSLKLKRESKQAMS